MKQIGGMHEPCTHQMHLPMPMVKGFTAVPGELLAKAQTCFYADAVDAVFKALGVQ